MIVTAVIGITIFPLKHKEKSIASQSPQTIAVLPFVDLSPGKGQEHLGDGIADILINALSRAEGLQTSARTSASYFKGKDVTPQEIALKLSAEWILEGSVQVFENQLRVVASLLRVADGITIWTDRYDRGLADIFGVEDEIARTLVDRLKIKIMGDKKAPLVNAGTANVEAYIFWAITWRGKPGSTIALMRSGTSKKPAS